MGSRNRINKTNMDANRRHKRGTLAVCTFLAGMALLSMLAGCGLGSLSHDRFSSEAEAKALLRGELYQRYHIEFDVVGEEKYHDFGQLYGYLYSCKVAPKDEPEKVAYAAVWQRYIPAARDDFATWYFKDEAEKDVIELLENNPDILSYTVNLQIDPTDEKWDENASLDEFMKANNGAVNIVAYVEEGKSKEEYADMIIDTLNDLGKLNVSTILGVKTGDKYIYFKEINIYSENPIGSTDKDYIMDRIN